jgi:D-3-phosphoglycerate dehydrogenase
MALSLPKQKIRLLLLEGVNDSAVRLFEANGYAEIERLPKALDAAALGRALAGVHMLGIRSRTQLTSDVLEANSADVGTQLPMLVIAAATPLVNV